MRKVIIMRGIPGSGKSYEARQVLENAKRMGLSTAYCSADNYFMSSGEYKFEPKFIGNAHISCMVMFIEEVIRSPKNLVIVDNTNTQVWEYTPYLSIAQAEGYEVEIRQIDTPIDVCLKRQTHGVPETSLKNMHNRFQSVLPHHKSITTVIEYKGE